METNNNERVRAKAENKVEIMEALRPLRFYVNYDNNALVIRPEDLETQLASVAEMNDNKKKKIVSHAFAMAEVCLENREESESEKWKNLAEKNSVNYERYAFIKSKLNADGTLKLDESDIAQL